MTTTKKTEPTGLTRRDALKLSGLALGSATLGNVTNAFGETGEKASDYDPTQTYTWFNNLKPYYPGKMPLGPNNMRITFLGTSCIPRLSQECNSVFVELGNGDSFVFDCGSGVTAKYCAMGIPKSKMDKIFLTHLHGDHMSDLTHIYLFGPSEDRKSPLYIWGPSKSNVPDPKTGVIYDDGTKAFCKQFRQLMRWHTESFSFLSTSYASYEPPWYDSSESKDGYDIVPFELQWDVAGTAYENNGVKITHFPAVHCRQGSISYKLEWNGLSMIFTGDTKPSEYVIRHATKGVDVLIHEIVVPPQVWAAKNSGLKPGDQYWKAAVNTAKMVQESSHTPEKAFGYILSQLKVPPRLAVGTHFQASDDTVGPARRAIRKWYPEGDVIIATDFLVLDVSKTSILKRRAVVSDFTWLPYGQIYTDPNTPKYHTADGEGDPTAQLDPSAPVIDPNLYNAR